MPIGRPEVNRRASRTKFVLSSRAPISKSDPVFCSRSIRKKDKMAFVADQLSSYLDIFAEDSTNSRHSIEQTSGQFAAYLGLLPQEDHRVQGPVKKEKRSTVNLKERKRNEALNHAFLQLQRLIPYVPGNQRLPKIKTLRLAVNYIGFLQQLLEEPEEESRSSKNCNFPAGQTSYCCNGNGHVPSAEFAQIVAAEIQTRNSYKERADLMLHEHVQQNHKRPRLEMEQKSSPESETQYTWPKCSCCPY